MRTTTQVIYSSEVLHFFSLTSKLYLDVIQGRGQTNPPSDANSRCATADSNIPSKITGPAFEVETDDLGLPQRRDPDHLPPRNALESVGSFIYVALLSLGTGNVLFAIKGGVLTVLLAMPSLFKHSARIAYGQSPPAASLRQSDVYP